MAVNEELVDDVVDSGVIFFHVLGNLPDGQAVYFMVIYHGNASGMRYELLLLHMVLDVAGAGTEFNHFCSTLFLLNTFALRRNTSVNFFGVREFLGILVKGTTFGKLFAGVGRYLSIKIWVEFHVDDDNFWQIYYKGL